MNIIPGEGMLSFQQEVEEVKEKINERLFRFLEDKKRVAGDWYNKKLYSLLIDFAMRGGKRLRPILMVEAYKASGRENIDAIMDASLSMEFVENYLLIHDDIIDRDDTRRGGPSFHKMVERFMEEKDRELVQDRDFTHFGLSCALIGGDVFSSLALLPILESPFPSRMKAMALKEFALACEQCFRGELMDIILEKRGDVDEDEFIRMVDLKTGSYTTCLPLVLGGIFGGLKDLKMLGEYGKFIGRAFQITDDILGTFGDDKKTGKPTSSDIRQGKKTLLVIYVFKNAGSKERKFLKAKLGSNVSEDDMERIKNIMVDCGAVDYSQKRIEYYTELARESLLSSPLKYKGFFLQFIDYLKKRKF